MDVKPKKGGGPPKHNGYYKKNIKKLSKEKKKITQRPTHRTNILTEAKSLELRVQLECREGIISSTDKKDNKNIDITFFSELPLSNRSLKALDECHFKTLTPIQKQTIPLGLAGFDIMGEAETGSGKTLAFIVPVLENLFRQVWEKYDGLGALIITPTRELAAQIFDVLRDVGKFHTFSAICLMGGKNIQHEIGRLSNMNIIIATPGRLLQHLEETPLFDVSNLKILVIDEADMLLDLGFSETMTNILQYLPPSDSRQNMLFSATLTAAVHRLVVLSLKDNVKKVTVNSEAIVPSEDRLKQFYLIVPLERQMDTLFSLLRGRSTKKMILFVNSCKQVRYICEAFWRLKPGCALFELHGRQHQQKRLDTLEAFSAKPSAVCLVCTDVAARGIDFPSVDIVIQMNCPPDFATYVHRIGRTARYEQLGISILFLLKSESIFLNRLAEKKITLQQMSIRPDKILSLQGKLASLLAANPDIKYLAQRYLISYIRSIQLFKDKGVFNLTQAVGGEEGLKKFALSLGLSALPAEISQNLAVSEKKNKMTKLERLKAKISQKDDHPATSNVAFSKNQKRLHRLRAMRQNDSGASHLDNSSGPLKEESDDGRILIPVEPTYIKEQQSSLGNVMDRKDVQKKIKKQQLRIRADGTAKIKGLAALTSKRIDDKTHHVFFDDNGHHDQELTTKTPFQDVIDDLNNQTEYNASPLDRTRYLNSLRQQLQSTELLDKERERNRVRLRHAKKRNRPPRPLERKINMATSVYILVTETQMNRSVSPDTKKIKDDVAHLEDLALKVIKPLVAL